MASGSISGQVRFDEFCRPSINQFAMAINGAPPKSGSFSIQEGSAQSTVTVAGIKLGTTAGRVYDYQFKSLAPGNYQISAAVNPKLLSCPAAEWEPSSISVTLTPTAMNAANRHLAHQTRIEERRIHGGVLAASIEGAAKGTTAKLHNYGPRHDNSWYAKDKSVITLGPGLGGMTLTFGFGEAVQEPWRYYVRDVHLASLDASLTASQIRLRLRFEEEGEELKGHCATDNYAYKTLCLIGDDKAAPDVDMSNIWLDLLFTPGVDDKGRVVVVASTADFNADLQAQGVCNAVDICNLLTGYKTNVEQAVDKAVVGLVQDPVVMTSVSNALAAAMLKLKIGRALSAQVDNGDLVVRHIPQKQ